MEKGIFTDREKAAEAAYFRKQEAKLIEQLRAGAKLDDIAVALGEKLQVDNPELVLRVKSLGLTVDTAPALFLAPLVQVAWAEGSVTKAEHATVLRLARDRGVEVDSPAYAQLVDWLRVRPEDAIFDTAAELQKQGFAVLPPAERTERINRVVEACQEVAMASGSGLAALLGIENMVSNEETSVLDTISRTLRSHG
jgi:hypothetical protein